MGLAQRINRVRVLEYAGGLSNYGKYVDALDKLGFERGEADSILSDENYVVREKYIQVQLDWLGSEYLTLRINLLNPRGLAGSSLYLHVMLSGVSENRYPEEVEEYSMPSSYEELFDLLSLDYIVTYDEVDDYERYRALAELSGSSCVLVEWTGALLRA